MLSTLCNAWHFWVYHFLADFFWYGRVLRYGHFVVHHFHGKIISGIFYGRVLRTEVYHLKSKIAFVWTRATTDLTRYTILRRDIEFVWTRATIDEIRFTIFTWVKYIVCINGCYDRYNKVYHSQLFFSARVRTRATLLESKYILFKGELYSLYGHGLR